MKILEKLKQKFHYSLESIKNRYPCKLIEVTAASDFTKEAIVSFRAVTRINIRKATLPEMLDDPMLIEKFHPTEAVKLGFLSAGEILLKNSKDLEEAKSIYQKILNNMLNDINGS